MVGLRRIAELVLVAGMAAGAAWAGVSPAVDRLEALPLATRETAAYHQRLALAYQAAGQAGPAAEALATASILPPDEHVDLAGLREWLASQGVYTLNAARAARARGDNSTAIKKLLIAVKCDAKLLAQAEPELKVLAQKALAAKPELRFQLGFFAYLAGDRAAALAAFEADATGAAEPYRAWRSKVWATQLKDEDRAATDMAASARHASTGPAAAGPGHLGGPPSPPAEDAAPPSAPPGDGGFHNSTESERAAVDAQIQALDRKIQNMSSSEGWHYIPDGNGKTRWIRDTDSRSENYADDLKAQRAKLQNDRDLMK